MTFIYVDDPYQRQVLKQPLLEEPLAGDRSGSRPIASMLDYLTMNVRSAKQPDQARIGRGNQHGPLSRPARPKDVISKDIGVHDDRRGTEKYVRWESTVQLGEAQSLP